jgi:hypothetical protein
MTRAKRVALVAGIVKARLSPDYHARGLLLDTDGQCGTSDEPLFLATHEVPGVVWPEWTALRFLHPKLRTLLIGQLRVRDSRELQSKLVHFGVRAWSLEAVCEALVASGQHAINAGRSESQVFHDILAIVAALYLSEDNRSPFPPHLALRLPTHAGTWDDADTLYFGAGDGETGDLLHRLYGNWAPECLLRIPADILPQSSREDRIGFFKWLGVAEWPRTKIATSFPRAFLDHVCNHITWPAFFGGVLVPRTTVSDLGFERLETIDGLDEWVSGKADAFAVLEWLSRDDRAPAWERSSTQRGALRGVIPRSRGFQIHTGSIPSFVRWTLRHSSWLPTCDGTPLMPGQCVCDEPSVASVLPRPAEPDAATLGSWSGTGTPADLRRAWERAGVLMGFRFLPWTEVYQLLLDLPKRDPEGKAAKNIYRLVLEHEDTFGGDNQAAGKVFKETGTLFGYRGGCAGYYPIAELLHLPPKTIPAALVQQLAIAATEGLVGAEKIKRYLFLESLKLDAVKTVVLACDSHPKHDDLRAQLAHVKPWLIALLKARRRQEELTALARFDLMLCTQLTFRATYGDHSCQQSPELWQPLLFGDMLWICAPSQNSDIKLGSDLVALALSNGFASSARFTVRDTEDLVRLARCAPEHLPELLRALEPEAQPPDALDLQTITLPSRSVFYQEPIAQPAPPAQLEAARAVFGAARTETIANDHPPVSTQTRPAPKSGPLQITRVKRGPVAPRVSIAVKLQSTPSNGTTGSHVTNGYLTSGTFSSAPASPPAPPVSDGTYCEKKAMEFELHEGRFPLHVGPITGWNSPRCDVLSFASAEQRDAFRRSPDASLVLRFIEAKDRGAPGAKILLQGNALNAAEAYRERYFLYRFHTESDGGQTLTILSDPIGPGVVKEPAFEINLDVSEPEEVRLSGGLNAQSAAVWDGETLPDIA